MTDGQITEFLTKSLGVHCRIHRDADHFDFFSNDHPHLEMTFGLVSNFRDLAAIVPMLRDGIREHAAEREAYLAIKTQKRGPYQKKKRP